MSNTELEEKIRQVAGEAYGKGTSAEDVSDALESVQQRFDSMAEQGL